MTILHGDDRFYNNIFVQQPPRADLEEHAKSEMQEAGAVKFVCGTKPFDGYPTFDEYKERFAAVQPMDSTDKDRYYDHLPIWTGGNAYFNGAQPCDKEAGAYIDEEHGITLQLSEDGVLHTNLYDYLPNQGNTVISTETLGMAFEPEEFFENPDGSQIIFTEDYYGKHHSITPLSGPFARAGSEFSL